MKLLTLWSVMQADLDESRVLGGIRRVDGGQVRRHSDVGDNHLQVMFADDLADVVLHPGDVPVGHLQAGAGRRLHVDDKLAGVGAREEGQAQQRDQRQAHHKAAHDENHGGNGALQRFGNGFIVLGQHAVVVMIETGNEPSKQRLGFQVPAVPVHRLDEPRAEQRHNRHRHQVGRGQGQHHAERQCSE